MNLLTFVRSRFHPLWLIRVTPGLHRFLALFDFPVWKRLNACHIKMRVMWFRDLPWLFTSVPKEPELNAVFEQLCAIFRPKVFWDVGANLGWYCWLANDRSQLSRALVIEPLPLNGKLLASTIRENHLDHVRVVNMAVADHCEEVSFLMDTKSGATSQIKEIFASSSSTGMARAYDLKEEIRVRCTTLDALLAGGEPVPDLMKVDVEEAETLVFKGAAGLLAEARTVIVFESWGSRDCIEVLLQSGYQVFVIDTFANYLAVPSPLAPQAEPATRHLKKINA